MNALKTKLKGWLTNISLTSVIAGLITAQAEIIPAFIQASKIELNLLSIVGVAGAIWGVIRKSTKAYKES
tara:strand:+ start:1984 stop:2193 length:210 start_codon:yes stop_codon:yes gene_type:complete